jgi:tRNA modification GTPase
LLEERPSLLVRCKADLVPVAERESEDGIPVSVVTAEGIDRLRRAMAQRLFSLAGSYAELEPMLTRERHRVALSRAADALGATRTQLGKDAVLAAHHIREAVGALEELVGLVHPEEVLGRVFSRFCVGK